MPRPLSAILCAAVAAVVAIAVPLEGRQPAAAGPAAPALTVDQQLAFLREAQVVDSRRIGKGITGALRVTLRQGAVTHDAAFQSVAQEPLLDGKRRAGELRFVDHYRYNIAAWRLAVLLGLSDMMAPTVERTIDGQRGALSWWVDDVAMDEAERETRNVMPPNALAFTRERQRMWVFAELVRDTDRNKGNIVYTRDWRVIMLDFTRAFRLEAALRQPALLAMCDRRLLAAMRALTRPQVEAAAGRELTGDEVKGLLARRDLLVAHFDRLVAERGERVVLY